MKILITQNITIEASNVLPRLGITSSEVCTSAIYARITQKIAIHQFIIYKDGSRTSRLSPESDCGVHTGSLVSCYDFFSLI
jgi:hypothetical protein